MLGQGVFDLQEDKSTKSKEKFVGLGGYTFEVGHHTWFETGNMHTQSYDIKNGEWEKRRFYIWNPVPVKVLSISDVYQKMDWLIGEWQLTIGENRTVKMRFSWADNQRMIKYQSTNPSDETGAETLEAEGIITYHGVKDQVVFLNTYMGEGDYLISEGWYEFKEDGNIHRRFVCHYRAGEGLPWSEGAKAPKGGKSIEFKQIWTPLNKNAFQGEFYWKKDGQWEQPIKNKDKKKEAWQRVK